jgi:phosphoribosylformylglycinamidine synthase
LSGRVRRIFVERRQEFALKAQSLCRDLKENLQVAGLEAVRIVYRYDFSGVTADEYARARDILFAEPLTNLVYEEELPTVEGAQVFAVEYLPVQFDQQADLTAQCLQALTGRERPPVRTARVFVLQGRISPAELDRIKAYVSNAVDSREASLEKPPHLETEAAAPADVAVLEGFNARKGAALQKLQAELGLAMDEEDLLYCQAYFRDTEKREPTITELRLIDTYWSDHCRHTTFQTVIEDVAITPGRFTRPVQAAYEEYQLSREAVYGEQKEEICLMDLALLAMKELRKKGRLPDLDESEEVNACSIVVPAEVNGQKEEWLVMFKNETHNHPTEIEPFGGAATCLGGAIRDPLSGRAYVYQAMRVTGSADPRVKLEDTLSGKLPSSKITTEAAAGYSSYGNQIGVPAGYVAEFYAAGFRAKRMEVGAVIAAAPKKNVVRQKPVTGDVVLLVGGRTGRDGLGGATGSSQEHTAASLLTSGAEVQKGNAPVERRIQRLFRRPEASTLIKRCNDFGAGGVSVAIGELTEGLEIDLDAVPLKYAGLDGTEVALSESQERMAVVVPPEDVEPFCSLARAENLEATVVARVTDRRQLQMLWRGQPIVNLSRDFLDSSGVRKKTKVLVTAPAEEENYFRRLPAGVARELPDLRRAWLANLEDLNVCSRKGLVEIFDSTAGAGTVLLPLGGKYQDTPAEGMVATLPLLDGETTTATIMTCGYDPHLSEWSPFHGACYAVVEAAARVAALGGDYRLIRLTLQEYFERLGTEPARWGKPFSALLGAFYAQKKLGIPAIGGKDSMSGTFMDLNVPPTLIAFAVSVADVRQIVSAEFKRARSKVVLLPLARDAHELPDFAVLEKNFSSLAALQEAGLLLAAGTVKTGGLAATLSKMAFGNRIGLVFDTAAQAENLFRADYGSLVLELAAETELETALQGLNYQLLGVTQEKPAIQINNVEIDLEEAYASWQKPLENIFCTVQKQETGGEKPPVIPDRHAGRGSALKPRQTVARPRVLIPVFPGTNGEDDAARAFTRAGALVDTLVISNLSPAALEQSRLEMARRMEAAQIFMLSGGFSDGGEPDSAAKLMVAILRDPRIEEAVLKLLEQRDGLILGICNGFQALVKLGLLPTGEFSAPGAPRLVTLTMNQNGRYLSRLVQTRVVSTLSPWFSNVTAGELHTVAISHGEGRFVAGEKVLAELIAGGQVATQYADFEGNPSYESSFNPNGSQAAIEGITSPDGRILGRMAHPDRMGPHVALNIPGDKMPRLFEAGVNYFR